MLRIPSGILLRFRQTSSRRRPTSRKFSNQHIKPTHTNSILITPPSRNASGSTGLLSKDVREVQIPVPWGHISGKWWGRTDVQPILAIHGWQDNSGSFDNLVPLLNVKSLLAIDLVGHGKSSHYPIGNCYHYIDEVINIRRIVEHFKWDKVSLIGHSIGSTMAFAYAGYFPDGVDKYVSIDCVRGAIQQDHARLVKDIRDALESNLRIEEKLGKKSPPTYKFDDIVDLYVQASHGSLTQESCKILMKRGLTKSIDGKYTFSRDPRLKMFTLGFFNEDFLNAFATQITCEVLSIRGKQGFAVRGNKERVYLNTLDLIEKSAKRFEHYDVEGTHHLHLNTPEIVAPLINNFLAEEKLTETNIY